MTPGRDAVPGLARVMGTQRPQWLPPLALLIFGLFLFSLLLDNVAAQGTIKVASVGGLVEHRSLIATAFVPLSSSTVFVSVGERVRTGPGAMLVLELPGGAFMIVYENSMLTIQDPGAPNPGNLINVMMGKVRFRIQRLGGKANPYGIGAGTALMAVRG